MTTSAQMVVIAGQLVCTGCGAATTPGAAACQQCGAQFVRPEPAAPPAQLPRILAHNNGFVCSQCGGFVRAEAASCKHCGVALTPGAEVAPAQSGATAQRTQASPAAYLLLTIILIGGGLVLCNGLSALGTSIPTSPARSAAAQVRYELSGTGGAVDITITNATGATEQKTVTLPWSLNFPAKAGTFVYLSAQNGGLSSASTTCKILVDGVVIQEATASGEYKIAGCSGAVGR